MQHNLEVADGDNKQKKKIEWKPEGERRNVAKLKDEHNRMLFKRRVNEIMSDDIHDLWGSSKEGAPKAFDKRMRNGFQKKQATQRKRVVVEQRGEG